MVFPCIGYECQTLHLILRGNMSYVKGLQTIEPRTFSGGLISDIQSYWNRR